MTQDVGMEQVPDDLAPLLEAASRGDEASWRELVARYARRVFALARSRCKDADMAEEITQSVFATVAMKIGGGLYVEQGRFESWLFRIAMNRLRDLARRAKSRPVGLETDAMDRQAAKETGETSQREALDGLRAAMLCLSDSDREVIELRHHGGLSFKQIADLLEEPLGTLLARHHRALRKLKELMEGAMGEPATRSTSPTAAAARVATAREGRS